VGQLTTPRVLWLMVPAAAVAPVLTTALDERFTSRGEADFADRVLSAMRFGFGGHLEGKG
jgi:6-phosphogluconate dehydrogenase